ncbi:MAG TPA: hypothetical protein VKX16_01685 [Chloroflexota bacterium]|nr:hypothetical protein [Chloroflexota bacterium]
MWKSRAGGSIPLQWVVEEILAAITDLMFQSRVLAAARFKGRRVRFITSPASLQPVSSGQIALVDLDARLDVVWVIRQLKSAGAEVVAFGPHLDTPGRKLARSAGADRVLAKSKFVTELPKIMEQQRSAGEDAAAEAVARLQGYGRRMEELGRLFQDPASLSRIYFAPDPHMEARRLEDPIVLDSADYLPFLAVESLRSELDRLRGVSGPVDRTTG